MAVGGDGGTGCAAQGTTNHRAAAPTNRLAQDGTGRSTHAAAQNGAQLIRVRGGRQTQQAYREQYGRGHFAQGTDTRARRLAQVLCGVLKSVCSVHGVGGPKSPYR